MTFRTFRFSKRLCDDNTVLGTDIIMSCFEENSLRSREVSISKGAFSVHVNLV